MKELYIYNNYNNQEVMETYISLIISAFEKNGYSCKCVTSLSRIKKNSLIFFLVSKDAFKFYLKGYHNFIEWQQGIASAESYMRHHSKIRKKLLDIIDRFVLKKAKMVFYVSNAMKEYYESKFNLKTDNKSIIMPCFNETLDTHILNKKRYKNFNFAYVGSLSEWQCFNETLVLYEKIEKTIHESKILILTFEVEKAKKIIEQHDIHNYIVKTVPSSLVKKELEDITYGFVIRKDNVVNRVATPTKISSYLSAGVIPIFSSCLEDFAEISTEYDVGFGIDDNDIGSVLEFVLSAKNEKLIKQGIVDIFNNYYSYNHYFELVYAFVKNNF